MCDGTQDITLENQESIVIRYIDEYLKVQEKYFSYVYDFIHLHQVLANLLQIF